MYKEEQIIDSAFHDNMHSIQEYMATPSAQHILASASTKEHFAVVGRRVARVTFSNATYEPLTWPEAEREAAPVDPVQPQQLPQIEPVLEKYDGNSTSIEQGMDNHPDNTPMETVLQSGAPEVTVEMLTPRTTIYDHTTNITPPVAEPDFKPSTVPALQLVTVTQPTLEQTLAHIDCGIAASEYTTDYESAVPEQITTTKPALSLVEKRSQNGLISTTTSRTFSDQTETKKGQQPYAAPNGIRKGDTLLILPGGNSVIRRQNGPLLEDFYDVAKELSLKINAGKLPEITTPRAFWNRTLATMVTNCQTTYAEFLDEEEDRRINMKELQEFTQRLPDATFYGFLLSRPRNVVPTNHELVTIAVPHQVAYKTVGA